MVSMRLNANHPCVLLGWPILDILNILDCLEINLARGFPCVPFAWQILDILDCLEISSARGFSCAPLGLCILDIVGNLDCEEIG